MNKYITIELKNNNKYIMIDMLEYENKKYFLLAQILNETSINNEFNICIYNEENNYFIQIEDDFEYNNIKDIFQKRLENTREKLLTLNNINIPNIVKLKVIDINDYKYTFQNNLGKTLTMNIEIFGNLKIQLNDYLYIPEEITKETIIVRFGPIYTDKTEIIKLIRNNETYYLQRYYG